MLELGSLTVAVIVLRLSAGTAIGQSAPEPLEPTSDGAPAANSAPAGGANAAGNDSTTERWNLYYQATSIGQRHGTFPSPYSGPLSLQPYPEHVVSLTTTLLFG